MKTKIKYTFKKRKKVIRKKQTKSVIQLSDIYMYTRYTRSSSGFYSVCELCVISFCPKKRERKKQEIKLRFLFFASTFYTYTIHYSFACYSLNLNYSSLAFVRLLFPNRFQINRRRIILFWLLLFSVELTLA